MPAPPPIAAIWPPRAHCGVIALFSQASRSSVKVQAFTVTLKTPEGEKKINCPEDTYILDAAEVSNCYGAFSGRGRVGEGPGPAIETGLAAILPAPRRWPERAAPRPIADRRGTSARISNRADRGARLDRAGGGVRMG